MCAYLKSLFELEVCGYITKEIQFHLETSCQAVIVGACKELLLLWILELSFQLPDDTSVLLKLSVCKIHTSIS